MTPARRIDRDTILAAAFDILDGAGANALTMRTLATRLHVQAASLYYHIPRREALLQLIADRVVAEATGGLRAEAGWRRLCRDLATNLRATLRAHPGAASVVAIQHVSPDAFAPVVPMVLDAFHAGLDITDEQALYQTQSLYLLVVGQVLAELGAVPEPPAAPTVYYDTWFDLAVDTYLDGIAARHAVTTR